MDVELILLILLIAALTLLCLAYAAYRIAQEYIEFTVERLLEINLNEKSNFGGTEVTGDGRRVGEADTPAYPFSGWSRTTSRFNASEFSTTGISPR